MKSISLILIIFLVSTASDCNCNKNKNTIETLEDLHTESKETKNKQTLQDKKNIDNEKKEKSLRKEEEPYERWGDKETIHWFNTKVDTFNKYIPLPINHHELSTKEQQKFDVNQREEYKQTRIKLMKNSGPGVKLLDYTIDNSLYDSIWNEVEGNKNILYVIPSSGRPKNDLVIKREEFYKNYAPQLLIDAGYNDWINIREITDNNPVKKIKSGKVAISDFPSKYTNSYIAHVMYPLPPDDLEPTKKECDLMTIAMKNIFDFAINNNLSIYIESPDFPYYSNYSPESIFKFARTIKEKCLREIKTFSESADGKNLDIYLCSGFDSMSMYDSWLPIQY